MDWNVVRIYDNKNIKLLDKGFTDVALKGLLEGSWFDTQDDRYGSRRLSSTYAFTSSSNGTCLSDPAGCNTWHGPDNQGICQSRTMSIGSLVVRLLESREPIQTQRLPPFLGRNKIGASASDLEGQIWL